MPIRRSTIQLLRFPFSFFLLPVYLFALSTVGDIDWPDAVLIFFILHMLVYPASNGYNSYMDRDEGPVGGLANPMQPTRQLFLVTLLMDVLALLLSFLISLPFCAGILMYILASRAYSYRGIRLKQYPWIGYLTVVTCQGMLTFALTWHGTAVVKLLSVPLLPATGAGLLIGGFYPLTQVYQHDADRADGITTLSMKLGYRGTFLFCGVVYTLALACIGMYYQKGGQLKDFLVLTTLLIPVLVFFVNWARSVWKNVSAADFKHTMRMNVIASVCSSAAFLFILILKRIE